MKPQRLTDTQARALAIIRENAKLTAARFAKLMWPDAEGWNRAGKCGPHGSARGVGMRLAGGAYIGKLRAAGLIDWDFVRSPYGYTSERQLWLTTDGDRLIREHASQAQTSGTTI